MDNVVFKLVDDLPMPPSPATLLSPAQLTTDSSSTEAAASATAASATADASATSAESPQGRKAESAISSLIAIVSIAVIVAGVAVILWVRHSGQQGKGGAVPVVLRITKFSRLESREGVSSDNDDEDDEESAEVDEGSKPQGHPPAIPPTPLTFQVRRPAGQQLQKVRAAHEPVRGISMADEDDASDHADSYSRPAAGRPVRNERRTNARSAPLGAGGVDLLLD